MSEAHRDSAHIPGPKNKAEFRDWLLKSQDSLRKFDLRERVAPVLYLSTLPTKPGGESGSVRIKLAGAEEPRQMWDELVEKTRASLPSKVVVELMDRKVQTVVDVIWGLDFVESKLKSVKELRTGQDAESKTDAKADAKDRKEERNLNILVARVQDDESPQSIAKKHDLKPRQIRRIVASMRMKIREKYEGLTGNRSARIDALSAQFALKPESIESVLEETDEADI